MWSMIKTGFMSPPLKKYSVYRLFLGLSRCRPVKSPAALHRFTPQHHAAADPRAEPPSPRGAAAQSISSVTQCPGSSTNTVRVVDHAHLQRAPGYNTPERRSHVQKHKTLIFVVVVYNHIIISFAAEA